jgi:hypothetical protein
LISRYYGLLDRNDFATVEEIAATPDAGLLAFGDVDVFECGVLHCRGKGIVRCLLVAAHDRKGKRGSGGQRPSHDATRQSSSTLRSGRNRISRAG